MAEILTSDGQNKSAEKLSGAYVGGMNVEIYNSSDVKIDVTKNGNITLAGNVVNLTESELIFDIASGEDVQFMRSLTTGGLTMTRHANTTKIPFQNGGKFVVKEIQLVVT